MTPIRGIQRDFSRRGYRLSDEDARIVARWREADRDRYARSPLDELRRLSWRERLGIVGEALVFLAIVAAWCALAYIAAGSQVPK